jgi:hypothetical protein
VRAKICFDDAAALNLECGKVPTVKPVTPKVDLMNDAIIEFRGEAHAHHPA